MQFGCIWKKGKKNIKNVQQHDLHVICQLHDGKKCVCAHRDDMQNSCMVGLV